MTYKHVNKHGKAFYLHKMKDKEMYFFKTKAKSGACELPDNAKVCETDSGLPFLRWG